MKKAAHALHRQPAPDSVLLPATTAGEGTEPASVDLEDGIVSTFALLFPALWMTPPRGLPFVRLSSTEKE